MPDEIRTGHTIPDGLGLWFQTEDGTIVRLDWNGGHSPLGSVDEKSISFDISDRDRRIAVALCQLALERLQRVPARERRGVAS